MSIEVDEVAAADAALELTELMMRRAGVASIDFDNGEVIVWNEAGMGKRGATLKHALVRFLASGWGKAL